MEDSFLSWAALALATYGAILSTYLAVRSIRSDLNNVVVYHGWDHAIQDGDLVPKTLTLTAINEGRRDVIVDSLALILPGDFAIGPSFLELENPNTLPDTLTVRIYQGVTGPPMSEEKPLKPGHRHEERFDYQKLLKTLSGRGIETPVRVRAMFMDTLENQFFSSWFTIGDDDA